MMFSRAQSPSQHLAQSPIILSVKRQNRYRLLAWFCLLVLLALAALRFCAPCQQWPWWPYTVAASTQARDNAQQREQLQKEVERLLLEQQIATTVRQKLEQQITSLQEQLKAAELQLDFFKSTQSNQPNQTKN